MLNRMPSQAAASQAAVVDAGRNEPSNKALQQFMHVLNHFDCIVFSYLVLYHIVVSGVGGG